MSVSGDGASRLPPGYTVDSITSGAAYTIRVVDTLTGAQKEYVNPAGRLASFADTSVLG